MTEKTPAAVSTGLRKNDDIAMTKREMTEAVRNSPVRGEMPEAVRRELDRRKTQHLVAAKMSEMNWGKGLDEMTRRAVAAYLERNKLDLTEVDVLGGNLYRNSRYYRRRLAELVDDGKVEYVKSDWVHVDKRLDVHNDDWSTTEKTRRERVRIEYGIPDAAIGACVFRVKIRGVGVEFSAAKWCGGGTRLKDPVGDQFPMETSESRACRRAMTLCASSIPALRWRESELDELATDVNLVIREAQIEEANREPMPALPTPLREVPSDDPYGSGGQPVPREAPTERGDDLDFDAELVRREL